MSKYASWIEQSLKNARGVLIKSQATQSARMIGYADGYVEGWLDAKFLDDSQLLTVKEVGRRIEQAKRDLADANSDPTKSIGDRSHWAARVIALEEVLEQLVDKEDRTQKVMAVVTQANDVVSDLDSIVDELKSMLDIYSLEFIDKISDQLGNVNKEVYKLTKMYTDGN